MWEWTRPPPPPRPGLPPDCTVTRIKQPGEQWKDRHAGRAKAGYTGPALCLHGNCIKRPGGPAVATHQMHMLKGLYALLCADCARAVTQDRV